MGTGLGEVISSEAKRPGREADDSPPSSAEVKKVWIYTSTPHTSSCGGAYLNKGTILPSVLTKFSSGISDVHWFAVFIKNAGECFII
jgi:hypothetical protein